MMTDRPLRITPATRSLCVQSVLRAPDGWVFTAPSAPNRGLGQNAKCHAMLADISRQYEFECGKLDVEDTKRMLVDAFARVKAAMGEPLPGHGISVPSLIGNGVVQLGIQTRRFSKELMAEFITYLHAWGIDHGVRFSDSEYVPDWYRDKEVA